MNRKLFIETLLLIVLSLVSGFAYTWVTKQGFFAEQNKPASTIQKELEIISIEKAKTYFDSRNAVFVDARHEFEYRAGHISGAVNIPRNEFLKYRSRIENIPVDKCLIVYCDGAECSSSIDLAVTMIESGTANVKVFFGGWQEWNEAKFPTEK